MREKSRTNSKALPIYILLAALIALVASNLYRSQQANRLVALIRAGKSDDALQLIAKGGRLNTTAYEPKIERSLSLLACAAYYKQEAVADELLRRGAKPDSDALNYAVKNSMTDLTLTLLNRGAKADQKPLFGEVPLLLMAVRNDNLRVAQALLAKGAESNAFNFGATPSPVVVAAQSPRPDMLRLLLNSSASPDFISFVGDPPLTAAVRSNRIENLRLLLKYHAHADVPDARGWSPLMYAVDSKNMEAIRILLQNHADPRFKAMGTQTALDLAKASPQILALFSRGAKK